MKTFLNTNEMAKVFNIKPVTLEALAHSGTIPHTYIDGQLRFNTYVITEWMQTNPKINRDNNFADTLKVQFKTLYPNTIKALKAEDVKFHPRKTPKLYSLQKVESKKYGFLYYVRYMRNGKLVCSRWNTRTNDEKAAASYAEENREKILSEYDARRSGKKLNLYTVLNEYYEEDSRYQKSARDLGKAQVKKSVRVNRNFVRKVLLPFFRTLGVRDFEDLAPSTIMKLQVYLLKKGNKPQTINGYLGSMKSAFNHLIVEGMEINNPFDKIASLKCAQTKTTHGCYELSKVYKVFNKKWSDEFSRLLNMVIYSTNLRNCELERIRVEDIVKIEKYDFIDIIDPSRTKNKYSVRVVPLHPVAHDALTSYIRKKKLAKTDYIFSKDGTINQSVIYGRACQLLGKKLGYTIEQMREENISFYSGRHYWKTLMNANGLGDAEEFFMGHKVSNDMAKLYNHRDKQGQKMILKKAREVFAILDKTLFKQ